MRAPDAAVCAIRSIPIPPTLVMHETARLLEAAAALSKALRRNGIPHAFYGSVMTAIVSNNPHCDEIFCIVECGASHAFKRVIQALAGNDDLTAIASPWCNRLHVKYARPIPVIEMEILPSGEEGPRRLDPSTVISLRGIPFLTISEFIRAKLKAWTIRRQECDAADVAYVLSRFWDQVDINRVPEQDMREFVAAHRAVASAWSSVKKRYRG